MKSSLPPPPLTERVWPVESRTRRRAGRDRISAKVQPFAWSSVTGQTQPVKGKPASGRLLALPRNPRLRVKTGSDLLLALAYIQCYPCLTTQHARPRAERLVFWQGRAYNGIQGSRRAGAASARTYKSTLLSVKRASRNKAEKEEEKQTCWIATSRRRCWPAP